MLLCLDGRRTHASAAALQAIRDLQCNERTQNFVGGLETYALTERKEGCDAGP